MRHGETVDNVNQILQGQTQGMLTPHGVEQAEQVAREMAAVEIDFFVSSDLRRAFDTCSIIARRHNKSVQTTPLLRERDWGGFTGKFIPDLKGAQWPDDVETMGEMKERARRFLRFITKNYAGRSVLAVGHGIMNKVILSVYMGKPMNEIEKMQNAEVRTLKL